MATARCSTRRKTGAGACTTYFVVFRDSNANGYCPTLTRTGEGQSGTAGTWRFRISGQDSGTTYRYQLRGVPPEPEPASTQISATTPSGGGGGRQGTEVATAEVTLDAAPNPVPEGTYATVPTTLSPTLNEHVTIPLTVTRVSSDDGDHSTLASVTVTSGNATATSTITTTTEDADRDEAFTVAVDHRQPGVKRHGRQSDLGDGERHRHHPEEGTLQTQVIVFFPAAPTGPSAERGTHGWS